jgi:hypothetical protein
MMSMDQKAAIRNYQFAERTKSELLIASKLVVSVVSYPEKEKSGGRRMLIDLLDAVRGEINVAYHTTQDPEFQKAMNHLSDAISLVESDQYGIASEKIAMSVSAATTAAQTSWQVLSDHGLI